MRPVPYPASKGGIWRWLNETLLRGKNTRRIKDSEQKKEEDITNVILIILVPYGWVSATRTPCLE